MVDVITILYDWLAQSNMHQAQMVFLLFLASIAALNYVNFSVYKIYWEIGRKNKRGSLIMIYETAPLSGVNIITT